MHRIHAKQIATFVLIAAAIAVGSCTRCAETADKKRDVILIVIDTLRVDRVGALGRTPTITPHLDKFAEGAVVYDRAFAPSSWTKTSVASLLTGLNPYRHGVFEEPVQFGRLPDAAETLAEALKNGGYHTTAVSMNPHIAKLGGYDQGFDDFVLLTDFDNDTPQTGTDTAVDRLEKAAPKVPQFLYLHYLDPHDPWPKRTSCDRFLPDYRPTQPAVRNGVPYVLSGENDMPDLLTSGRLPRPQKITPLDVKYLEGLYDCEVSVVDEAVGKLFSYLAETKRFENAIVVVTSDHGEEFFDHGLLRHGYQLFNETVHVPLFVSGKGFSAAHQLENVSLADLAPTLYRLLGISAVETDGRLLPGLPVDAPADDAGAVFGMTRFRKQHSVYLISGRQKVLRNYRDNTCSFYDLEKDPKESAPLPCDRSDAGRKLAAQLDAIKASAENRRLKTDDEPSKKPAELTAEEKEKLKHLGYVVE